MRQTGTSRLVPSTGSALLPQFARAGLPQEAACAAKVAPGSGKSCSTANTDFECEESLNEASMPSSHQTFGHQSAVHPSPQACKAVSGSPHKFTTCLLSNDPVYAVSFEALQAQPHLTAMMRAILFDWMMEVCAEFCLKRDTFHLAAHYVDRAFATLPSIARDQFQLIGLCAMYAAAKAEELYVPRLRDWARAVDNGYTVLEIQQMERRLLQALQWRLYPATAYTWLIRLMVQWDNFVKFHYGCELFNNPKHFSELPKAEQSYQKKLYEKRMILFVEPNRQAYRRYREALQVLDAGTLHPDFMKHSPRHLAVGLLYLMVSKHFYQTSFSLLHYPESDVDSVDSQFDNAAVVQDLYLDFCREAAEVADLKEVYAPMALFHQFLGLSLVHELPHVCKFQSKQRLESHYFEFLAYQTHNPHNLDFLRSNLA